MHFQIGHARGTSCKVNLIDFKQATRPPWLEGQEKGTALDFLNKEAQAMMERSRQPMDPPFGRMTCPRSSRPDVLLKEMVDRYLSRALELRKIWKDWILFRILLLGGGDFLLFSPGLGPAGHWGIS